MAQINKEFFNNMAHEFRTPLTNISLAGNLLAKKTTDPTHQRYLDIVKEESGKQHPSCRTGTYENTIITQLVYTWSHKERHAWIEQSRDYFDHEWIVKR